MLLVDANVLVNAVNEDALEHPAARGWLTEALGGTEAVAFPWAAVVAFLRVSTHPNVLAAPLHAAQAVAIVERWLAAPAAVTIEPTPRHLALVGGLLAASRGGGNLVNDAHLAALAFEHAATVVSFDRDFARFEGLRLLRPGTP